MCTVCVVRSKVEYAYSTLCNFPKYIIKKIQNFQHLLLRRCTGLSLSTPILILRCILGELPVSKRSYLLTTKEFFKVKFFRPFHFEKVVSRCNEVSCSYTGCYQKFIHIFKECEHHPHLEFDPFQMQSIVNFKRNLPHSSLRSACLHKLNFYLENDCIIYATDGSVNS